MELLSKISNFFGMEKKSQEISLLDTDGWYQQFGVNRKATTRLYYNRESAFTAYRAHELVYACINKIADVMNDAEIVVEVQNSKGEWDRKDGHPLPALFKRPNPFQTGRDVRKLLVQSEQAVGRFYLHINRSNAGLPVEFSVLNPYRVEPKWDAARENIVYYEYIKKDGRRVPIKKEDLLIRRRVDLVDQYFGFAPLEAALKSINSDLGMTDYIDAFFESDGTPSGILKILNATVSQTKREEIQAQWKRKYSRGGSNQKGLAVLDQNAEYQKIGSNMDELASDSLTGRFESRICAVFGVPPNLVGALVGLQHVTANATAKAELRNLWDNKISPELAALREWLTWFVLPEFEDIETIKAEKVRVGFDISQAAFLQEDLTNIHTRARENFKAGGWTLNEFREETGKAPDPDGDYYIQPINVTQLSPENRALEAAQKVPAGKEPAPVADPPAEPAKLAKPAEKKTFDLDGLTLAREPRGVELIISLKSIADDYESEKEKATAILTRFRDALIDQAGIAIEKLDADTVYQLTLQPDTKIVKQVRKTLEAAYARGRAQVIAEINAQNAAKGVEPLAVKKETEAEYLAELIDLVISKMINEVQGRAINRYTLLKMLLDYSVEKLTEALKEESVKYVETLAGNSVNAAIRSGRDDEMTERADQIASYEYSAILDVNTCTPCGDADGQTAADPEDLPSAPNPECDGGPNCRCFIVAVTV